MILEKLVAVLGFDLQNEGDVRRFNNGLRSAGREADLLMVGLRRLAAQAAVTFGGMAAAWKAGQFVANITKTGAAFEEMGVRLKALEGSAAGAEKAMAWITDFAKRTPLELNQVVSAYANLRTYGLDPTNGSLQSIVDAMAATGGGAEQLNGIIRGLGQAWTKQKLQGEEIMQLLERGVPVWDMLAKSTGKSVPELQKLSQAGKLGRKEIQGLIDQIGTRFAGASEEYSKTFAGITSNLKDNWTQFLRAIADSGYFADVKYRLKTLLDWVNAQWDNGTFARWTQAISDGLVAGMAAAQRMGEFAWNIGKGFFYAADGVLSLGQKITGLEKVWVGLGLGAGAAATTAFGRAALLAIARKVPWIAALLVVEDLILALESPANKTVIGSTAGGRDAIRAAKRGFAELKGAVDDFAASINKAFGIEADKGGNMAALIKSFSEWAGEWAKGELVRFVEDLTKAMADLSSALNLVMEVIENPEEAWTKFADVAIEQLKRIIYTLDEYFGHPLVKMGLLPSGRTGTWDAPAWEGSGGPASRPNNRPTPNENKGFGGSGASGSWEPRSEIADTIRKGAAKGEFNKLAPRIMRDLMRDQGLTREQAAGVVGSLGGETGGFRHMQEIKPVIPGSRGGYGWAQWTGPRRRAFEAWTKARGLDPNSYEANYGFLQHEMNTTHKREVERLKRARTAEEATRIFTGSAASKKGFLRPGTVHLKRRLDWTRQAIEADAATSKSEVARSLKGKTSASEAAQNLQGNIARIDGATAATNATMVRDQRAVNQTITVGDVHAAPGERVDRATARAVAGATANAARVSEPARIAAQPAAAP